MHNQDTAKDDFMEAIMEIMNKLAEFYKINREEKKKEEEVKKEVDLETDSEQGEEIKDERVLRFQKAMKNIIENTESEQVKVIAQTFHDNPIESMKMLQAIVSEQTVENAQFLSNSALATEKFLGDVKSAINMDDPRAMDLIATLDALKNEAKNNHEIAESIVKDVRPLDQTESLEQSQNEVLEPVPSSEPSSISVSESKELLNTYFNSLSAAEKNDFEEPAMHVNEDNKSVILHFESKKDIESKTKSLILNLEDGTGREVNVSSNSNGTSPIANNSKDFNVSDLRQLRDKSKVNETEKEEKEEKLEMKKEKSKDREMDGPER